MDANTLQSNLTNGSYAALFTKLYGAEAANAAVERYLGVLRAFEAEYPGHKEIAVFSTPGRTEIGGNHTDHNAGFVLAGAVNLDIISIVAATESPVVRLKSEGFPSETIDLSNLEPVASERYTSAALVRGVAARMQQLGYKIGGFDCYAASSVPNGAGLSSSAAFEVQMCSILNHLYNGGVVDDVTNAQISQYAENEFFGKPCGLMDQMACAVGGLLQIDFKDFDHPIVNRIDFDFAAQNHVLFLVKTGGSHADLNEDYTALENEMKMTARQLGYPVLRFTSKYEMFQNLAELRKQGNDRAILRAYHYFNDNERVLKQTMALQRGDFVTFKKLIIESGYSSFMYCQNIYANSHWKEQGVAIALMLAEDILQGKGAWRVHGGGFAGTIQAFVPNDMAELFKLRMNAVFGDDACHQTMIRPYGTMRIDTSKE